MHNGYELWQRKTGNGEIVEESRDVKEDFDVVSASEGIDVFVTQGSDFNISVEADENIIDLIGTDIKDGRLKYTPSRTLEEPQKRLCDPPGDYSFGKFQWC